MSRRLRPLVLIAVLFAVGCAGTPDTRPDTGARATAETFFAGLTANDPPRAYATLHPDSTKRVSAERFAVLVRSYRQGVGFPPERAVVRISEENGDAATVHVTLTGHAGGHSRRYEDGVTLRRHDGRWGVVLSPNFGTR